MSAGARLRLWFGFSEAVDRRTYFTNGCALMLVKYAVDAAVMGRFTGRFWTPLDYVNPMLSLRIEALRGAPAWVGPALILFALPFLWIGASMSLRRATDAGLHPATALLFFVPVVNFFVMVGLSLAPSRAPVPVLEPVRERLQSALLGVAASVGLTVVTVVLGVYLRRTYSTGLFLGTPFTIGYICSYIYNQRAPRTPGQSIGVAIAGVLVACGTMVLFALEGAVCVAMAFPLALLVAIPGALLGRAVALRGSAPPMRAGAAALLAPLLVAVEPGARPSAHEVITVVDIAAPPATVWRHVVSFPVLPPPEEWLFRAGVAAPVSARVEGTGVGAVRYCDFTTGSFTEPITAWEEGRLLSFDITAQAPPMRERSPYARVDAPHLNGYFRATHGEFRLTELPGGRTRLEGRTRYTVDMFPQSYWTVFAGGIVEAIHQRVLAHIRRLSEG